MKYLEYIGRHCPPAKFVALINVVVAVWIILACVFFGGLYTYPEPWIILLTTILWSIWLVMRLCRRWYGPTDSPQRPPSQPD